MIHTASLFLLAVLAALFAVDVVTLRKNGRRVLLIEAAAFLAGGVVIAFPQTTQWMASVVGIGRGVDLVVYLSVVWLVREAILMRHARIIEGERFTQLVRAIAVDKATTIGATASDATATEAR